MTTLEEYECEVFHLKEKIAELKQELELIRSDYIEPHEWADIMKEYEKLKAENKKLSEFNNIWKERALMFKDELAQKDKQIEFLLDESICVVGGYRLAPVNGRYKLLPYLQKNKKEAIQSWIKASEEATKDFGDETPFPKRGLKQNKKCVTYSAD